MSHIEIDSELPTHPAIVGMDHKKFRTFMDDLFHGLFPPVPFDPVPVRVTPTWVEYRIAGDRKPSLRRRPVDWSPAIGDRPKMPDGLRALVLERDGAWCAYCGATELLQIDHIFPWSRGGRFFDPDNLQVLCRSCNARKGARLPEELG